MKVYNSVKEFREYIDREDAWGSDGENSIPVYMTSGGFDPLHVGHLRCILATVEMAESDGGYVAIIVNGDGFLRRKKGKSFMTAAERAEIIAGIRGVDAAIIWDDGGQTVIGAIETLKPDYFTKGGDRAAPEDIPEWEICKEVGCEVVFNVGGVKVQSSSWLLEEAEKNAKD
jgi:D-beta-D-heptose 7-phosphate kinase/D-beta-D-heptose 1-phosphate adenosyltransferase